MKKPLLALIFTIAGFSLLAQTPRMSLYEEFTGETCPPCAATNPGLDLLLQTAPNPTKIIPIKWQVPIPSAPTPTWSLYKTNKVEIDWRYATYGYGVNSAPSSRIDGQNATVFGQQSDHPGYLTNAIINTASSYTTPFSIGMTRAWDNTFSSVNLTVNIQASASFTANGSLVCRVVMIEKEIHFATQPGTNGETDFNWVVRKSFPSIQAGTPMAANWTNGQTQTFTLNCVLPAYIVDKAQVAFVAFIQDDGNRMVWQAAQTNTAAVSNDAKALSISVPSVVCSSSFVPQASVINNGDNAITSLTVAPSYDGVAGSPFAWTGNLAVGASTLISLPSMTVTSGSHTFSYNITNVSGGDFNPSNNNTKKSFLAVAGYQSAPVAEGFTVATFPPVKWGTYNPSSSEQWVRTTAAGFQSSESAKVDFFTIASGTIMDLVLPPLNVSGAQAPFMTFDVAYAQYSASYNDRLEVLLSTDCGASWASVYDKAGANLKTAAPVTTTFVPTSDQWRNESVELVGYENATSLIVKFRATSNFGNNLYIDNVNLKQWDPTGIKNQQNNNLSVELFPNPTKGETSVKINTPSSSTGNLTVVNVLGQIVYTKNISLDAGLNVVKIDAADFASGVYNVIIESNNTKTVKKLSVN